MTNQPHHRGTHRRPAFGGLLLLVVGLALPVATAQAQNALGDGRLLEKQTGNAPLPPVRNRNESFKAQMRLNDSIVTGNATGGKSFRGNAGYSAPGDFRGRLGSDDLFNFARDSSPAPNWADSGSNSLRYQLERTTSLKRLGRNVDGMLGRGNTGQQLQLGAAKSATEDQERYSLGLGTGSLRSTSAYQIGRALSPTSVGRTEDSKGTVRNTLASGLRGLTVQNDFTETRQEKADAKKNGRRLDTSARSRTSYDDLKDRLGKLDMGTGLDTSVKNDLIPTTPGAEFNKPQTPGGTDNRARPGSNNKPSGEQPGGTPGTNGQPSSRPGGEPDFSLPTSAKIQPGQRNGDPTSAEQSGAKTLGDQRTRGTNPGGPDSAGSRLPGEGPRDRDPVTGLPSASAGSEAWRQRMVEIRKALDQAEKDKAEAKTRKVKSKVGELDDPRTPEERSRREAARKLNGDTVKAIRDSGGTVDKFVSNLSPGGEERDVYAEAMASGQKYLAEGRYFDAEDRFVRARILRPDDATALIGRLHSQLGAGMVLSASLNLRQIIREHPELIGVRYGPSLLPSSERMTNLQKDLDLTINPIFAERLDMRARREAALLKAYVGFQINDRVTIANSLRLMEDTSRTMGEDESTLSALLRGVWLGEAIPAGK